MIWNYGDIQREFPESMSTIEKIPVWISKCDFARLLVIYKYGGFYIDLDYVALRPFDNSVINSDIILVYEPEEHSKAYGYDGLILNGMMASIPKHPFFKGFIKYSINLINTIEPAQWNVLSTLGPPGLYKYYNSEWKNLIYIPKINTCKFSPSIQPKIQENVTKTLCNSINPYCTTIWENGTNWASNPSVESESVFNTIIEKVFKKKNFLSNHSLQMPQIEEFSYNSSNSKKQSYSKIFICFLIFIILLLLIINKKEGNF